MQKGIPLPQVNVASYKWPRIRLLKHTTTVPPAGGGEGRIGTATMFQKKIMLPKYAIFSTVLFKIVAFHVGFLRVAIIYKNYKFFV